jgi:4-hydroxybenzoate polyprenyltransferase
MAERGARRLLSRAKEYLEVLRPDHWFKNVFMILGFAGAIHHIHDNQPSTSAVDLVLRGALGLILACLTSAANYITNEIVDAKHDIHHPVKKERPIPSGRVSVRKLIVLNVCVTLGCFVAAVFLGLPFFITLVVFYVSALFYNIPPVRLKDVPYADVITESISTPLRILLGWFALVPPNAGGGIDSKLVSFLILGWTFGAFLMTGKRYAELRFLENHGSPDRYRITFRAYTEKGLFRVMGAYLVVTSALYLMVSVRYAPRLLISSPFIAGFFAWYIKLAMERDSIVKEPERLLTKTAFTAYCLITFAVILGLVVL